MEHDVPDTAPPRVTWRTYVAAALLLVAGLAAAELVVGRWIMTPSASVRDPRFGHIQRPGSRMVQGIEGFSAWTVNRYGRFGAEPRTPRPPALVLLVGDSYAEALQLPYEHRLDRVAERAVPGLQIFDAAQSGLYPVYYPDMVAGYDSLFHFDDVVVQVNDGDVTELLSPQVRALAEAELATHGNPAAPEPTRGMAGLRAVLRNSALLKLVSVRLDLLSFRERDRLKHKFDRGAKAEDAGDVPAAGARAVDPAAAALMDSVMTALRHTTPHVVFLYIPQIDYFVPTPAPGFPERRAFWHAFAERNHVELVDPTDAMLAEFRRTRQPLHGFSNSVLGSGHINERGHRVVGEQLAAVLRRRLTAAGHHPAGDAGRGDGR